MKESTTSYLYPEEQDLKLKIIIVGDSGVGKTNLRMRFCHGSFQIMSEPTVGVQYSKRKFWAPLESRQNKLVTCCFWDAAGKLSENQLVPTFFKNIIGIVYVFDLTKQETLQNLKKWRSYVYDHLNVSKVSEILIGNKNDLIFLREVSNFDAQKFKKDMDISLYFQTSALQNININEAFYAFISLICKQINLKGIKHPIKIVKKERDGKKCFY